MRHCNRCQRTLPIENFSKDRSNKSGYRYYCKGCCSSMQAKYAAENRDYYNALHRRLTKNPKRRAWAKKWSKKRRATWIGWCQQRWSAIQKRTVNGATPRPDLRVPGRYIRRGIELRMTFQEFKDWCCAHQAVIDTLRQSGLRPSLDRIDYKGHYELSNLQIIPFRENCRKDGNQYTQV